MQTKWIQTLQILLGGDIMGTSIIGIAFLASKVATVYMVATAVTAGLQYYHDFKLTKTTTKGRGKNDYSDVDSTVSRLKSKVSQPE